MRKLFANIVLKVGIWLLRLAHWLFPGLFVPPDIKKITPFIPVIRKVKDIKKVRIGSMRVNLLKVNLRKVRIPKVRYTSGLT